MELLRKAPSPFPARVSRVRSLQQILLLATVAFAFAAAPAHAWPQLSKSLGDFQVTSATASNTVSDYVLIDNPLTNNNPGAIVFVSQNWNPGGGVGIYNNHNEGVWYSSLYKKWAVFNQDVVPMPTGPSFDILIPGTTAIEFVQTATAGNITGDFTTIDNPLTNGNPNAVLTVSQNWNPGGAGGVYNNHPVGVFYTGARWAVFNEDGATMPAGPSFNVLVSSTNAPTFVHTATAGNISGDHTVIDNPATNGKPNLVVTATQNWNPGGVGGTYNNHAIGVYYTGTNWAIFNEDLAAMPPNAAFNVTVLENRTDEIVHTGTAANTVGDYTLFDLPETNGTPGAIAIATQNWNPPGAATVYNAHPVGVWYSGLGAKWGVFNEDVANMPVGASFNIMAPGASSVSFIQASTDANRFSDYTLIDNPTTNGKPNAILIVTQDWNPGGGSGVYSNHNERVFYSAGKWAIFYEDRAAMPAGPKYNVLVLEAEYTTFVHTATAGNISSNWTTISNPGTDNNPNAALFVTQDYDPGGVGGTYNNHPIGVWYTGTNWAIFNQDLAPMPVNASFNVFVGSGLGALAVDGPSNDAGTLRLLQNRPNPVRGKANIQFILPVRSAVSLDVLDIAGREVSRLVDGELEPGPHEVVFDAKGLASGVYLYRLRATGVAGRATVETRKLLVTR